VLAPRTRVILISLAGLLMAGFSLGCQREHKRTIAVIPKGSSHLFWQSVHAGAVKAAREKNVDVIWNGPATETDFGAQLQIVDAMINRHVDAIALAPIDRKAMISVVDRSADSNIPMIIFDSGVDTDRFVSRIATDNYKAGGLGAERLAKILNGKGQVIMVAVQPGAASTEAREKGFEDVMRKNYPGIRILDKRYGMAEIAKSLTVAENMLTAHPEVDGIFASNESSTMGAAQALRSRQGKIKLVGFDWSPTLLDDLNSGLIDSLVVQNPFRMGYESVITAVKKLDGQSVVKINDLEPRLVDKSNLNDPEIQAQLHPDLKRYLN
jgi:ribose transport system substrate-binding protein